MDNDLIESKKISYRELDCKISAIREYISNKSPIDRRERERERMRERLREEKEGKGGFGEVRRQGAEEEEEETVEKMMAV